MRMYPTIEPHVYMYLTSQFVWEDFKPLYCGETPSLLDYSSPLQEALVRKYTPLTRVWEPCRLVWTGLDWS